MSQKVGKKSRRRTEEDELKSNFKSPGSVKMGSFSELDEVAKVQKSVTENSGDDLLNIADFIGFDSDMDNHKSNSHTNGNSATPPKRVIQTRSRSSTPVKKGSENDSLTLQDSKSSATKTNGDSSQEKEAVIRSMEIDVTEMDPLIITKDDEEPHPELAFDETSDHELEPDNSPSRCKTRRSQTRHIPTPKTPKSTAEGDEEKTTITPTSLTPILEHNGENETHSPKITSEIIENLDHSHESFGKSPPKQPKLADSDSNSQENDIEIDVIGDDLNDTLDSFASTSSDNISTKVLVGSDETRKIDFSLQDSGLYEDNSSASFNTSKDRSLTDTLRGLSSRRPIRGTAEKEDYRKRAWRNNIDVKGDSSLTHSTIDRIHGVKRKHRSITPDDSKRAKSESMGFLSYIPNPLTHLRNPFVKSDLPSSTPKLTGYKDKSDMFETDDVSDIDLEVQPGHHSDKKWCSIM